MLILLLCQAVFAQANPLFVIQRSLNTNEVIYDLDASSNLVAYWRMLEKNGEIEELTGLERRYAYGTEIKEDSSEKIAFTLKAVPEKVITVSRIQGTATTLIGNSLAILKNIYVVSEDGFFFPTVAHVDLNGVTMSGLAVTERLIP